MAVTAWSLLIDADYIWSTLIPFSVSEEFMQVEDKAPCDRLVGNVWIEYLLILPGNLLFSQVYMSCSTEKSISGVKDVDRKTWELTKPVPLNQKGKSMEDFIGATPDVHYIYVCVKVSVLHSVTDFLSLSNFYAFGLLMVICVIGWFVGTGRNRRVCSWVTIIYILNHIYHLLYLLLVMSWNASGSSATEFMVPVMYCKPVRLTDVLQETKLKTADPQVNYFLLDLLWLPGFGSISGDGWHICSIICTPYIYFDILERLADNET